MDDEDGKVRRNLVTVAFATIAGSFVKISVTKLAVFGLSVSTSHPGRVWLVLFLVLVYLIQRYHFSDIAIKERKALGENYGSALKVAVARRLQKDMQNVVVKKKAPSVLGPFATGTIFKQAQDLPDIKIFSGTFFIAGNLDYPPHDLISILQSGHLGVQGATFSNATKNVANSTHGHLVTPYNIPRRQYVTLLLRATAEFLFNSKPSVNLVFPYVLGAIASVICASELGMAAYARLTM
ncbi:hypothetical protein [Herbaspirillum sp. 1130]|uniref:hypothetical protein n=1 Tax=Herbaspirillum sp. 1130 TaxID=2806562 RepID=UPI001AE1AC09|nr:hypothetical protein [Herbaspirillum sp. 1130]MBP1314419.1 hypothetical protein [Herbaspirillum sp. 1130]